MQAAGAESNVLTNSQVHDVDRWQRELAIVARRVRKADRRRKGVRDDAAVGETDRWRTELRIGRGDTREDRSAIVTLQLQRGL